MGQQWWLVESQRANVCGGGFGELPCACQSRGSRSRSHRVCRFDSNYPGLQVQCLTTTYYYNNTTCVACFSSYYYHSWFLRVPAKSWDFCKRQHTIRNTRCSTSWSHTVRLQASGFLLVVSRTPNFIWIRRLHHDIPSGIQVSVYHVESKVVTRPNHARIEGAE